jgi:hypothetical protein
MKLEIILDKLGSLEKNSFIKIVDNIISKSTKNSKEIEKLLVTGDKSLKSVDNQNITKIFELIENEFTEHIKYEFQTTSSQLDILIDIIIRDGNCILKKDWFSRLYEKEIKSINNKTKSLVIEIESEKSEISIERKRDYRIYKSCLYTAYNNDIKSNRDAKVTDDELSILVKLAKELSLSQEEVKLINYSIIPVKKSDILDVVNSLKNIGVIFYSKKDDKIYVADEMVRLLRKFREKEIADKFFRRTLKLLREPIINQIAKKHSIDRKLNNSEKIEFILKEGISFTDILKNDIYKDGITLNEKKKELNELCEKGLEITTLKGSTLEDKIESLITYFEIIEREEKVGISLDGYEKMLTDLNISLPKLNKELQIQFEFNEDNILQADFLLDYNIKPRDILDLVDKDELLKFIKDNGVKQRGDNILNILEHYKDTENLFLENYENIGKRNLNLLKENGIVVKESELGIKFEELTKVIFTKLGFNVDEKLRSSLNTKSDKLDILLNISNNEIIIIECKTIKESGYNKFSSVSRQLKAYQSLAEKNNLIVSKVLLIAPDFSDDFISDCEMNVEIKNLCLITASTLFNIQNEFKNSKFKEFPHVLFRDIVINEERILKAINK